MSKFKVRTFNQEALKDLVFNLKNTPVPTSVFFGEKNVGMDSISKVNINHPYNTRILRDKPALFEKLDGFKFPVAKPYHDLDDFYGDKKFNVSKLREYYDFPVVIRSEGQTFEIKSHADLIAFTMKRTAEKYVVYPAGFQQSRMAKITVSPLLEKSIYTYANIRVEHGVLETQMHVIRPPFYDSMVVTAMSIARKLTIDVCTVEFIYDKEFGVVDVTVRPTQMIMTAMNEIIAAKLIKGAR